MEVKCFDWLASSKPAAPQTITVVHGNDAFLRREAVSEVQLRALGKSADEFGLSVFEGGNAEFAEVHDELCTSPLLGDRRLVIVRSGDEFITKNRKSLERYVSEPATTSTLVLEAQTWPATTNLAKTIAQSGLAIDCDAPKPWHVAGWCIKWAKFRHGKQLSKDAAEWLVEVAGHELGVLDQELAKLALFIGKTGSIDNEAITRISAGSHTVAAFKLLDAMLDGKTAEALALLDRQLVTGESPQMLVGLFVSQLRKLTEAARRRVAGMGFHEAMSMAGIKSFVVDKSIAQLQRLGRRRMADMYQRLLDLDADLKGRSAAPPRLLLERFVISIAQ